jgi:hypothetical protein
LTVAVINVPKTPEEAFNPRRRPGTLIQHQLTHLEWAIRPAAERTQARFRVRPAKTEAEAAARIEKLTRELVRRAKAEQKRKTVSRTAKPRKRATARRTKSR